MLANYHTHTALCHHATGTAREYIETAIARGLTTLGFADHAPIPYPPGHAPSGSRMTPEQLPYYVDTLLALKEEYHAQITLHIGLEAEYFPTRWEALLSLLRPYPIEYLILGQHYYGAEDEETTHAFFPCAEEDALAAHTARTIAGMRTGAFTYVAHPDVFHFTGDVAVYRHYARQICQAAKEMDIPLEINLLGMADGRNYPNRAFWEVAADVGCTTVLGCDAHSPARVAVPQELEQVAAWCRGLGLRPLPQLPSFRPLFS